MNSQCTTDSNESCSHGLQSPYQVSHAKKHIWILAVVSIYEIFPKALDLKVWILIPCSGEKCQRTNSIWWLWHSQSIHAFLNSYWEVVKTEFWGLNEGSVSLWVYIWKLYLTVVPSLFLSLCICMCVCVCLYVFVCERESTHMRAHAHFLGLCNQIRSSAPLWSYCSSQTHNKDKSWQSSDILRQTTLSP